MIDETNYLTKEQLDKFLETIPKLPMYHTLGQKKPKLEPHVLQLLFLVIYEAALRVSELLRLTREDLIESQGEFILKETKGGWKRCKCSKWAFRPTRLLSSDAACPKCQGKGKFRVAEIGWTTPQTFKILLDYSKSVKTGVRLFPLSRQRVWQLGKEIGNLCGIELLHENKPTTNMTIHTLRHSRAVHLTDGILEVNELMDKLRHKSLGPTTTYVRVTRKSIREKETRV